jgi:hypothetical protein
VLLQRGAHPPNLDSLPPYFPPLTLLFLSQPAQVGDKCAVCDCCDPKWWVLSKKLKRADGSTPAPICRNPCSAAENKQIKKEAKEA